MKKIIDTFLYILDRFWLAYDIAIMLAVFFGIYGIVQGFAIYDPNTGDMFTPWPVYAYGIALLAAGVGLVYIIDRYVNRRGGQHRRD